MPGGVFTRRFTGKEVDAPMETIQNLLRQVAGMQWSDYLDIFLVALLIYLLLPMIKTTGHHPGGPGGGGAAAHYGPDRGPEALYHPFSAEPDFASRAAGPGGPVPAGIAADAGPSGQYALPETVWHPSGRAGDGPGHYPDRGRLRGYEPGKSGCTHRL